MEVEPQNDAENANDSMESVDAVTNGVQVNDADVGTNGNEISMHQINGSHSDISPNGDCLLRIIFRDTETYDELHPLIGKCVRDALFLLKKPANVTMDSDENSIKFIEITPDDSDSIFMVDPLPMENTNEAEIPAYNSSTIEILNDECSDLKQTDADDDNNKCRGLLNCWNCGGDHNMKDCKEKRDPAAISRAKQMFNQKSKVERYHLDAEQKYCHLLPGKLSDNLRQALGLRSRELPLYIYKMRLYGYPEGWLEEAKINHSGLSLFHSENRSSTDADVEDGEVDKVTFDASKFIEYPGFNAAIPSHLIDDSDYYKVPPMQFSDSKEGLTQLLQNNLAKSYKRKRLKLDTPTTKDALDNNLKDDDMDIQTDEETKDTPVLFPQTSSDLVEGISNSAADDVLEASSDSNQLSLLELKRKQEEILRALEDASSDSNSNSNSNSNLSTTPSNSGHKNEQSNALETMQTANECVETSLEETILETNTESIEKLCTNETESVPCTPTPSLTGQSREAMCGTPLIKQVSPYSKLPAGKKWSVGVTDVIDFENLPDSTGAYQKLTSVIEKVRSVVKRINEDTDHDSS